MARRAGPRRAKPNQRVTPRRWLPFVLALAAVAAIVVASGQTTTNSAAPPAAPPGGRLPVASPPRSVSSSFYCAGGTAAGSSGIAELAIVLVNADPVGTKADVTVYGSNGRRRTTSVDVPARASVRVAASRSITAPWAAMTVDVLGGRVAVERQVHGRDGFETSPCSSRAATRWYVPSGSTVRGATEYLALFNPFPDDTSVDISFQTSTGSRTPRDLQGLTVPAQSLRMVEVNTSVARHDQVAATVVTRSGRVVVDRFQRYDGTGDAVVGQGRNAVRTGPPRGLAVTAAIPSRSSQWLVPNIRVTPGSRPQIALYNPGSAGARVTVQLSYEDPQRRPPVEPIVLTVRAGEEQIVDLTEAPGLEGNVAFQALVSTSRRTPLVSELLLYRNAPSPAAGFTVMPAAPVAATRWLLAAVGAGTNRVSAITVANPWAAPVTVHLDALLKGVRTPVPSGTIRIPGHDRRTLDIGGTPGAAPLIIRSDRSVVVQRSATGQRGLDLSFSLATPFPETVQELP